MFSWTMLISGNKLAEQIRSAVFGDTVSVRTTEDKTLRDADETSPDEVKTLNS
ncbi:MAG: hypothetical protein KKB51_23995 [Candidatus Riflebacteria bacterium]|nr:hypothetical protein [Candidatus Riflebacteria bacterium]